MKKERLGCLHRFIIGQEWETALLTTIDTFEQGERQEREMRPLHKGEIEVIHGKDEARRLIQDGVFKKVPA